MTDTHGATNMLTESDTSRWLLRAKLNSVHCTWSVCVCDICKLTAFTYSDTLYVYTQHRHIYTIRITHARSPIAPDLANMWREELSIAVDRHKPPERTLASTFQLSPSPPAISHYREFCPSKDRVYSLSIAFASPSSFPSRRTECCSSLSLCSGVISILPKCQPELDATHRTTERTSGPRHRSTSWVKDGGFINIIRNNQKICHHHRWRRPVWLRHTHRRDIWRTWPNWSWCRRTIGHSLC